MKSWHLLVVYFTAMVGILIFLKGFFPPSTTHGTHSSTSDIPPQPETDEVLNQLKQDDFSQYKQFPMNKHTDGDYSKLVMIVVSSLRTDFVFGEQSKTYMPYTNKLTLTNGHKFISRAKPPTVTLPRIKALMTGNIPNFIDIIFNLERTSALQDDSLVHSAIASGKSMVFYGDDIWTRLFPNKFKRERGYPFLFTGDFDTIDNNITGNMEKELQYPDHFDAMILHYHGLKQMGYFRGSNIDQVGAKLTQIDEVIKTCYEKLEASGSKPLIVLTSEYGMSNHGSHGGITDPEVQLPLVFLSPNFEKNQNKEEKLLEVQQVDIVSTLALLLNLPIPRSSSGKSILPLIETLSKKDELHKHQYNCYQLLSLVSTLRNVKQEFDLLDPIDLYREALDAHSTWLQSPQREDLYMKAKTKYLTCQDLVSTNLQHDNTSFNYVAIAIGIVVMWTSYMGVLYVWGISVLLVEPNKSFQDRKSPSNPLTWGFLLTVGTILHSLSLFSSSFLEEEHQTWYYITITFLCILLACAFSEIAGESFGLEVPKNFYTTAYKQKRDTEYRDQAHSTLKNRRREVPAGKGMIVEVDGDFKKLQSTKKSTSKFGMIMLIILSMVVHRILRGLNQTGVQSAGRQDIAEWLNKPDHLILLAMAMILGLVAIGVLSELLCHSPDTARRVALIIGLVFVYKFRSVRGDVALRPTRSDAFYGHGIWPAWVVYSMIIFLLGRAIYIKVFFGIGPRSDGINRNTMDCIKNAVILLGSLLVRPHNIWGLAFNLFLYWIVFRLLWPVMDDTNSKQAKIGKLVLRITLCYWFSQLGYFSMGNSNSISTIDITSGYIGITSTHKGIAEDFVIASLILVATYIGPILWSLLCFSDILSIYPKDDKALRAVLSTLAFLRLTPVCLYVIMTATQRHHLFVWSVFSPKLLYEASSTFIYGVLLLLVYFMK